MADNYIEESVLAELLYVLQARGLTIDRDTAVRWVNFCGIRSAYFNPAGASQQFIEVYESTFDEIDEALESHQLFSALINRPKILKQPA